MGMGATDASLPFIVMVIVQFGYAGMNILSKVAMDSGMNPFVQVAYRQIFSCFAIGPVAYFLERNTRPKMTTSIFFQIFLCSIFGVTMNQVTYFVGLKNSTPTIACALTNLLPAVTFLLAVPFGLESVRIKSRAGQGKVIGTIVCVGGAMLLSFYNGPEVKIGESKMYWNYAQSMSNMNTSSNSSNQSSHHGNFILGPFLLILSPASWAVWFILQAKLGKEYPAPYSSTAWMCLMASVQCVLIGVVFDHHPSAWSLALPIRAVSSIYAGIVASALAYCMMSWCIEKRGPLYVSVFSPLLLVIVAVLSWALLREKLFVGTVVGSILIVIGLYAVLWGKSKEMEPVENTKEFDEKDRRGSDQKDLELQMGDR